MACPFCPRSRPAPAQASTAPPAAAKAPITVFCADAAAVRALLAAYPGLQATVTPLSGTRRKVVLSPPR